MMFRDATERDLPAVVQLLSDDTFGTSRESPALPLDLRYAAGFQRMVAQGGRLMLVIDDDAIMGCLQFNIVHGVGSLGQSVAQVESVRVDTAHRGRGAGRALMQYAMAQARAAGCTTVQLTTRLERTGAQRFYAALGFVQSHAGFKCIL